MAAFGADGRCLMRVLREQLDDPAAEDCGICAVCAGPRFAGTLDPALVREAALLLRSRPLVIEVKKMAPDESGAMKKLPEDVRAEEGRALARLGDGGWHPEIQAGLRAGRFSDELVGAAADLVRAWAIPADWIAAVPARAARGRPGARLRGAARRGARQAVRAGARARGRPAAPARDGQLGPAGRQRARGVPRSRATCRRARACWSTTSASAAGRSP